MDHGQQQITARVAFYFHYHRLPLKYYCTYLGGEKQQFLTSQSYPAFEFVSRKEDISGFQKFGTYSTANLLPSSIMVE